MRLFVEISEKKEYEFGETTCKFDKMTKRRQFELKRFVLRETFKHRNSITFKKIDLRVKTIFELSLIYNLNDGYGGRYSESFHVPGHSLVLDGSFI